jgi:GT2 family glycosyltransferase
MKPWEIKDVAIIIATFNEDEVVRKCIKDIKDYISYDYNWEIILVDNRNKQIDSVFLSEGTLACQYLEIVDSVFNADKAVTLKQNSGCGRGWGIGALLSTAKYLIFCDDGVRASEDIISPLYFHLQKYPNCGMVGYNGGFREYSKKGIVIQGTPKTCSFPLIVDEVSGFLWGTAFETFCNVGGLDPRFSPAGHEETDYAFNVRSSDYDVMRIEKPKTLSHVSRSSSVEMDISWLGITEKTRSDIDKRNKELFIQKWNGFPSVRRGVC